MTGPGPLSWLQAMVSVLPAGSPSSLAVPVRVDPVNVLRSQTKVRFGPALTTGGAATITAIRITGQPLGFVFAFANCGLFMLYVVLGHRIANAAAGNTGIDRLAAAMLIAAVTATPWGLGGAMPAFRHPVLLLAGAGVGVCSSVIPYVADQLAMARLPRATFSLMLALLPVFATIIGAVVLRQLPTVQDIAGITLVVLGVALHGETPHQESNERA